jgi:putative transcriptional regulator
MNSSLNLTGHIIIPQPKSRDSYFSKSVVLVAGHTSNGAWGLMVNKPTKTLALENIMTTIGIESNKQDKVFLGGPIETHRVHVVHSLDWSSLSTICINKDIGITNDVSVMAAIQEGVGPALYRTCLGLTVWAPGQLDSEYWGESPWKQEDRWLDAPASIESVFNLNNDEQWERCIEIVAKNKVSTWF